MSVVCSICCEKFDGESEVVATKCGHMFHIDCLSTWFDHSEACPHCRVVMRPMSWRKIFLSAANDHDSSFAIAAFHEKQQITKENKELKRLLESEKSKYSELFFEHVRLQDKYRMMNNGINKKNNINNNNNRENVNRNTNSSARPGKHVNPMYAHIQSKVATAWKITPN